MLENETRVLMLSVLKDGEQISGWISDETPWVSQLANYLDDLERQVKTQSEDSQPVFVIRSVR